MLSCFGLYFFDQYSYPCFTDREGDTQRKEVPMLCNGHLAEQGRLKSSRSIC